MADQDKARWTKLVADFEVADLSQRDFAHARGIPLSNLRYWIYRLRKQSRPLVTGEPERSAQAPERSATNGGSRLLPVHMVASAASSTRPRDESGEALLELTLPSGTRVRFPAGTDLDYLRRLAAAL